MKNNPRADLVIDALLMAVWRRQPKQRVLIHSDQGIQYTCSDWRKSLDDHNQEASMSRRGNCHYNAVAESFFSLLKTERIKRKIYKTRNEARADVFNYIEFFYNPYRRHSNNDALSPLCSRCRGQSPVAPSCLFCSLKATLCACVITYLPQTISTAG